jgi:hypothetical protein
MTPLDELVVEVTFGGLPFANVSVTLERVLGDRVMASFGPRVTNALGHASFGPAQAFSPPGENQGYRVRVAPLKH